MESAPWGAGGLVELDRHSDSIKQDVLHIILQYLTDEGLTTTAHTLRAEAKLFEGGSEGRRVQYRKVADVIMTGDWEEVGRITAKPPLRGLKGLHYSVLKQQFLEHIDGGDGHKAYQLLKKKLKPLEAEAAPGEFQALTYLLSCNSVRDSPGVFFEGWRQDLGRQRLVTMFRSFLDPDFSPLTTKSRPDIPPRRLWRLFEQACTHQIRSQAALVCDEHSPRISVTRLAFDYRAPVCPNVEEHLIEHNSAVKCCFWLGKERLACGLGNGVISIWSVKAGETPTLVTHLTGHEGIVWSVSGKEGCMVSGGADATVRLWYVGAASEGTEHGCQAALTGHDGDVYSVCIHNDGEHAVSGGFDGTVRLWNLNTRQQVQIFKGHTRPVTCVQFNFYGNMVITGSKDGTARFWDIASGICLRSLQRTHTSAAVSTVDFSPNGTLLVGYQDSSIRFWDMAAGSNNVLLPRRLQGHVNTSRNLVKAMFGPGNLVFSGSEDGTVCVWSAATGQLVMRLVHTCVTTETPQAVYDVRWNPELSMLATCSDDRTVRLWGCDVSKPRLPSDV
eukprot:TRINITY_DN530_c2_g1_i1.p2 TRINITY_DN530_c2_g1~~TRINITY_DN530_c2_g1_i1.p2  ORF type:complete len:558 (+),score=164.67 TRINITY_DN530_c2_g1_i1:50-1723(+)